MNSWKNYIWKVPLYCWIAGIIDFHLSLRMLSWTLLRLPDGTITSDNTKSIIVYAIIFMVSFFIGGFVFFSQNDKKRNILFDFCFNSIRHTIGIGTKDVPHNQWLYRYVDAPFMVTI